jgi:quinol monooxygenase YgiN
VRPKEISQQETLAEAREEFEKGGTIMVEKPTINGVLVQELLPKARPQEISQKGNNLVRADGSSEPFSKGQCGCCGYDVMSDQTRFSDNDSYYHQECWQELVATVEAVKKSMHEKRARKRIEAAVARGLDSDSILTPNALRSSSYTQSVCKKVQQSYGTIAEREDGHEDDEGEHGSELLELKRVFMEKARPEKTKFNAHLAYPMPPLKNPQTVNCGTIVPVANVANETSTQGIQQTKDKRQKDRFSAPHLDYPTTWLSFQGQKRKAAADLRTL